MSATDTDGRKELYAGIHPELRAQALVGYYLQIYALVETTLDDTLGELTGLSSIPRMIIGRNMAISDKLFTIRALTLLAGSTKTQQMALKAFQESVLKERNMIAHSPFGGDPNGDGVRFIKVQALGKLKQVLPEVWSIDDFLVKIDRLTELEDTLLEILHQAKLIDFQGMLRSQSEEEFQAHVDSVIKASENDATFDVNDWRWLLDRD